MRVTFAGKTVEEYVTKGCLQRGVLLPLLWGLVVDELIRGLNESCYYTLEYEYTVAIPMNGRFPNNVSEILQEALGMVLQWCERTWLSINP